MTEVGDVVIVGGGVIGLSIAYSLTRAGIRPTVIDRRDLGREASWAGAGLIPPAAERRIQQPLTALRSWSARLYPEWSARLGDETGIDIGYRKTGGVDVACTELEEQALKASAGRWSDLGIVYERLAPGDHVRVEPALSPELRSVYFLPDRAQVRNPRLLRALMAATEHGGGRLVPWCGVEGFHLSSSRVTALATSLGDLPCGTVVVAAGAWSGPLLEPAGIRVSTPPYKGQIVLLRGDRPLIRRVVENGKNYLVPRDDGRVLVGATEESVGFDTVPSSRVTRELFELAARLCPVLGRAQIEATWAGLRPGSVDAKPYIGAAPGLKNVIVATGHKRAGLQLAPATAELVVDLVLGRAPRLDVEPFRLDRKPELADDDAFRS